LLKGKAVEEAKRTGADIVDEQSSLKGLSEPLFQVHISADILMSFFLTLV
jgi:hypothetical protein